jgi:DNA-binding Lrp family transcriptional regulator
VAGARIDRIDLNILAQLQRHGRMTNVELAAAVGLSPSPCLQRTRRLEEAGYITGYSALLDLAKLGAAVVVFTEFTLTDHRSEDFRRFETALAKLEEVVECHLVSGGYDYLVKFTTGGVAQYQALIEGLLERQIGIARYFSYIVIKTPVARAHLPLRRLFPSLE